MHIECPKCECDDWDETEYTFFDRETVERTLECKACFAPYLVRYEAIALSEIEPIPDYITLRTLARNALPTYSPDGHEDDWGSDRQVEAEVAFWRFIETLVSVEKYNTITTEIEGNKMTTEESIKYGIDAGSWAIKGREAETA